MRWRHNEDPERGKLEQIFQKKAIFFINSILLILICNYLKITLSICSQK